MSSDRHPAAQRRDRHLGPSLACAVVLLLAAGLALAACGKKGDPLPPLRATPLRTTDLSVRQQGQLILLEMSYPATTASGLPLGGIDAIELVELSKPALADGTPPPVEPREFELGAKPLLTLSGAELGAAITGDRIQIRVPLADPLPETPLAYSFGVRSRKGEEVSALSNRVALVPIAPPPPPRNLQAEPGPNGITLTWEADEIVAQAKPEVPATAPTEGDAEAEEADEKMIEAFDIFRREAQNRGYDKPLRRVLGEVRTFVDTTARYGERYIYTVRTVVSRTPTIRSAEAGEVEVDYQDRYAPPLPTNFVALGETGSTRLRWDASDADDVAGYILYRREPGRDFHQLTESPLTSLEYIDRGLVGGLRYDYRIKVVDWVGNESELSPLVTATVR